MLRKQNKIKRERLYIGSSRCRIALFLCKRGKMTILEELFDGNIQPCVREMKKTAH